ncbi:hypothetical protein [Oceaniglobus indicus]|uniref:hypothetical protein n=1 Tax=Oceaniglobus indicus TaxID=2047749 RepID=UPI000C1A0A8A|nr:hypothetical protein [Oceaniglobus indicus]
MVAITERVTISIRAGVFDYIAEREECIARHCGQRLRVLGHRHHLHVGNFRTGIEIMSVDPEKKRMLLGFFFKPKRDVADVLLHPEFARISTQPAFTRNLQRAPRPALIAHDETARTVG